MTPTARIAGTGRFVPPTAVDNFELYRRDTIREAFDLERALASLNKVEERESLDELSAEQIFDRWARQVTGIERRPILDPESGMTTEEMCTRAAREALRTAQLEPEDVDLVFVATVTPSDSVPNAACLVASLLGVPEKGGYTVNGACTGFVHAVATAYATIRSGMAGTVLAVAGDALSRITDYSDPTTAILFSDGAAAAVLTASETPGVLGPPRLLGDYAREHLYLRAQGWEDDDEPEPRLRMGGGPRVLKRAILAMEDAANRALEAAEVSWDTVDLVVPHQANLRITRGLERQLSLPRGRVLHTIQRYGNCSAASVGIALDEAMKGSFGPLPRPCRTVLTAVGGGYTIAAAVMDV